MNALGPIAPVILVDTREQSPLPIRRFPVELATLPVGDYGVKGFSDWSCPRFIIERKSLDDLCHSLGKGRERFLREIEKMRQFEFRGLVIEATESDIRSGEYRSQISPASVMGSLDALAVRAGLHICWCGDAIGAARKVESLVEKFVRGLTKEYGRLVAASVPKVGPGREE